MRRTPLSQAATRRDIETSDRELYDFAMRFPPKGVSPGAIANAAAWLALAAVFAGAVIMTDVLGFLGLFVIGVFTWLVCVQAGQDDNPNWRAVHGRNDREALPAASPEQRAARDWEWQVARDPIRFLGRCGMALTTIGAAGFAWQYWFAAASNGH